MTWRLQRSSWRGVSDRIFHGCLFTLTPPLKRTEAEWVARFSWWQWFARFYGAHEIECLFIWWQVESRAWRFAVKNTSFQEHKITRAYIHGTIYQHHSLHPAYGHDASRAPKVSDKETAEQHPSAACARRYHKHNCQRRMLLSLLHLGTQPETPRYCLSG